MTSSLFDSCLNHAVKSPQLMSDAFPPEYHDELVMLTLQKIETFIAYAKTLKGDEKGEAQVFCDRLFQAFGHEGYKEAGAVLEHRVKTKGASTRFADLFWESRLLIEMKKRGENLEKHYQQAFEYWLNATPKRPRYVVLCNFTEFWIYDFDLQLREPVDKIKLTDLADRYTAFNFLFPGEPRKPQFANNQVDVTRAAADKVARVYNTLVARGEASDVAQRFVLQCVVALFSEDIDLLPRGLFSEILDDCLNGASSYDLIGGLFRQMGNPKPAGKGSRFQDVQYFNGGIFATVEPLTLNKGEVELLVAASKEKWSKVEPAIFGTLFEGSLGKGERHALGAHFTNEADIQKIILPTIVRPWRERIEAARTLRDLLALRQELTQFKVLDPACGSGNFLYVAYREMKRLEALLLAKIYENFTTGALIGNFSLLSTRQFYGLDVKPFAVELAKVTLMLGKKLALDEENKLINTNQLALPIELEPALPLDNLDNNIMCKDALFSEWPEVDAIIGNPPYQAKNKMQKEFGREYVAKVRAKYPEVPGRADYCVYWFKRAHVELKPGKRAGLVGTNTIRQNFSREGGLDYIVGNGGTITEAVSTQVWSGDAAVHVSIVNWIKGEQPGKKVLLTQLGDDVNSPWRKDELDFINSALSARVDVTQAKAISANALSGTCYQGQTHGHKGFLLSHEQAKVMMQDQKAREVIHPYMTGDDLLKRGSVPTRFVINLNHCDNIFTAMQYGSAFKQLQQLVLPDIKTAADEERVETGKNNGPRQAHFMKWWKFWRGREEMLSKISALPRYIACARVTKRPVFEFISSSIHPNDAMQVFALADDYSFGILQSTIHWQWFNERCSTLKGDFRYTSDTVFDSFVFPQAATEAQILQIANAARDLRQLRREVMTNNKWGLRELYKTLDIPGDNPLRNIQEELDSSVRSAYGMKQDTDVLRFLLDLNHEVSHLEQQGKSVVAPGLPPIIKDPSKFVSGDFVRSPSL